MGNVRYIFKILSNDHERLTVETVEAKGQGPSVISLS